MTVIEQPSPRPPTEKLSVEQFEFIARAAAREDVTLEYLNGLVETRTVPDSDHNAILMWVMRQFMTQRPDLDLDVAGQGLKVDSYRKGRARPDGILAPVDHFAGQGEWADPAGVLVVVEVTSWDSDTSTRDRVEKARAYAACDIGVYLLV
ncbi:Uma2 family endonuclease, partial [Nocardiopsis metallicus]